MRDSGTRPRIPPAWATIPAEHVPARAGTVSFFGSQKRQGEWVLPRQFRAVAILGSVKIDLTRARIAPGESHIEVRCVFGDIEVLVPPELRVECDGTAFAGDFEANTRISVPYSEDSPLIRVTGSALMGSVKVKVVDPNEPTFLEKITARLSGRRPQIDDF